MESSVFYPRLIQLSEEGRINFFSTCKLREQFEYEVLEPPYGRAILLCNKLPQNSAVENNRHSFSSQFCGLAELGWFFRPERAHMQSAGWLAGWGLAGLD